jgi:hypothetical protein
LQGRPAAQTAPRRPRAFLPRGREPDRAPDDRCQKERE